MTFFVVEQRLSVGAEWGGMDTECIHAAAYDEQGQAIGTGRLLRDGYIGRWL